MLGSLLEYQLRVGGGIPNDEQLLSAGFVWLTTSMGLADVEGGSVWSEHIQKLVKIHQMECWEYILLQD